MSKTKRTPTAADHRAAIERAAQTDGNYRVLLNRMRSREAGLTRQMTTQEIAAKYFGMSAAQTEEALGK
jgi:hypothetical protein